MQSQTGGAKCIAPEHSRQWQAAHNLLAVRLDASGDVLMCTPALHALAEAGASVSLLCSPAGALVGSRSHDVLAVETYSTPSMKATGAAAPSAHRAMIDTLRVRCFNGTVIFPTFSQSALPAAMLCWEAGISLCLAHCRQNPYQLLTDWIRDTESDFGVRH